MQRWFSLFYFTHHLTTHTLYCSHAKLIIFEMNQMLMNKIMLTDSGTLLLLFASRTACHIQWSSSCVWFKASRTSRTAGLEACCVLLCPTRPIGSVRSGYPVEGAAALGFRAGILRSSSGVKWCGYRLNIVLGKRSMPLCNRAIDDLMFS